MLTSQLTLILSDDAKMLKCSMIGQTRFLNNENFIENCELTKLGFLVPLYNNPKYCEFIKIGKSKILFYNNILLI